MCAFLSAPGNSRYELARHLINTPICGGVNGAAREANRFNGFLRVQARALGGETVETVARPFVGLSTPMNGGVNEMLCVILPGAPLPEFHNENSRVALALLRGPCEGKC
jgi:hypothetical protein